MKILFVSSEVVPFAKTGGLADVAAALPKAIAKFGHDIRIFMPLYKRIDHEKWGLTMAEQGIYQAKLPGSELIVYFVESEHFSNRDELYVKEGKDYPDNHQAFLSFCKVILPFLKEINWKPDVIHCNEWQSGPLVQLVKELRAGDPFCRNIALIYSIHNIAYQGSFPGQLPDNFVREGILHADFLSVVSKTYAKEIQTKEYGCGMEKILKDRAEDLFGIVNGVDYEIWNPATDCNIAKKYSAATLSLRSENKLVLQKQNGLSKDKSMPLIGFVNRLADQKGLDILVEAIDGLMELPCQLVLLGTGEESYHKLLQEKKDKYPKQIGLNLGFDSALAELIYAGSDMFLIPSKYEPCGLGQLISFKYGCIPVVRKTGGLADTVHEFDLKTGQGDGFLFEKYNAKALIDAVKRAVAAYQEKAAWKKLQEKVMKYDYSWNISAKEYISLYVRAAKKVIYQNQSNS